MKVESRRERIRLLTKRDGAGCYYCKVELMEDQITFDHYIPQSAGGTWDLENLRISCQKCNNRKSNLIPDGKRHPVPPPRPPKKTRAEKVKIRQARVPCDRCLNGRRLDQGVICPSCGREPFPPHRSHLTRSNMGSCSHTPPNWCGLCVLFPDEVRIRYPSLTA
jgi:hypothetical protein